MQTITHEKALELIKQLVKDRGSRVMAAKELDISPAYLGDILAGNRQISDNVARALGYRKVVLFQKVQDTN